MTRSEEIIWLAGILEGEGHFRARLDKRLNARTSLRVELQMTDQDVVLRASQIFPTKCAIYTSRRKDKPERQLMFRFQWSGGDAEKIMRAVLPYMGERRAAKIRECLKTPNLSHRKAIA